MKRIDLGSFHGEQHANGVIGYDYAEQSWVDTRPGASRDANYPKGSASNPLDDLPPNRRIIETPKS